MKIKVVSEFWDKFHTSTLFTVGTVLDFDEERAQNVISRGLAVAYTEPKKPGRPKAEPKPEPKPEVVAPKVEEKKEEVETAEQPEEKAE